MIIRGFFLINSYTRWLTWQGMDHSYPFDLHDYVWIIAITFTFYNKNWNTLCVQYTWNYELLEAAWRQKLTILPARTFLVHIQHNHVNSPSLILAHETTHRGYRGFNMPIYFLQVWGETVCHITTRMDKDKDRVMCTYVCVGDAGLNSLTMDACMLLCLARYN